MFSAMPNLEKHADLLGRKCRPFWNLRSRIPNKQEFPAGMKVDLDDLVLPVLSAWIGVREDGGYRWVNSGERSMGISHGRSRNRRRPAQSHAELARHGRDSGHLLLAWHRASAWCTAHSTGAVSSGITVIKSSLRTPPRDEGVGTCPDVRRKMAAPRGATRVTARPR